MKRAVIIFLLLAIFPLAMQAMEKRFEDIQLGVIEATERKKKGDKDAAKGS